MKVRPLLRALRDSAYLDGIDVGVYLDVVREQYPQLYAELDFGRDGAQQALKALAQVFNEFETDDRRNGRGDSYRRAQQHIAVRMTGIRKLFELAGGVQDLRDLSPTWRALDLLAGDGLLTRALRVLAPQVRDGVISSDIARTMVTAALTAGLPAIRQDARFLFMRAATMDAVILAYGSHHVPPDDRTTVFLEAARVLRPGGRFVVHDFEEGSPSARWFSEAVHRHSVAGHPYRHFTAGELRRGLGAAGLRGIRVHRVYDPFVMRAATREDAVGQLADYLRDMYGLRGLDRCDETRESVRARVWQLCEECFRFGPEDGGADHGDAWLRSPAVQRVGGQWIAEIPRVALVGVGEK
ncbi:SAM-dependent methyltransferase [Streptomyces chrestomyceticus JCM 4735]|uniref:SAM-dependent methyltransferase n=1 Tax=Streptomyces chrestomyceticus JCM 4735 TaxID=1306181 RepID=A0A7U9PY10_9ACTN|nr:class I SAM-dependent methyltransferase [Streptomyces chrestomyceticus]GCD32724.1 SAM-dependent methyltransferase [Streptomyces chrestomyceticus JCM 4735]